MSDNSTNGFSARFFSYTEFSTNGKVFNPGNDDGEMTTMPVNNPIENPTLVRPPFAPPIFGGDRDRTEMTEMFEQPTGWMDRLVDAFNINDTRVTENNGKTVIDTGMGNDEVTVTANDDGGVTVEVNGEKFTYTAEEAKNLEIRTGSGDDTVKIDGDVKIGITVRGESGNDNITGGGGRDRIFGGSGSDTIDGGRGNDYIHGGSGDDKIRGGRGNDEIRGGSGDDEIRGGRGNDTLHGGAGRDTIHGDRGKDKITRDWNDKDVKGGKGDDDISWDNGGPRFRPLDFILKGNIRA